jgi:hypothetical protein
MPSQADGQGTGGLRKAPDCIMHPFFPGIYPGLTQEMPVCGIRIIRSLVASETA